VQHPVQTRFQLGQLNLGESQSLVQGFHLHLQFRGGRTASALSRMLRPLRHLYVLSVHFFLQSSRL
jgi:hypothetical protein